MFDISQRQGPLLLGAVQSGESVGVRDRHSSTGLTYLVASRVNDLLEQTMTQQQSSL
jgi:hypothetical protein